MAREDELNDNIKKLIEILGENTKTFKEKNDLEVEKEKKSKVGANIARGTNIIGEAANIHNFSDVSKSLQDLIPPLKNFLGTVTSFADKVSEGAVSKSDQLVEARFSGPEQTVKNIARQYGEMGVSLPVDYMNTIYQVARAQNERGLKAEQGAEKLFGVGSPITNLVGQMFGVSDPHALMMDLRVFLQETFASLFSSIGRTEDIQQNRINNAILVEQGAQAQNQNRLTTGER